MFVFAIINYIEKQITTGQWFFDGLDKYERNYTGVLHAYIYSWWLNVSN